MKKAKAKEGKPSTLGGIVESFASWIRRGGAAKKPAAKAAASNRASRESDFPAIAQRAALLSAFIFSPLSAEEARIDSKATINADATGPSSWLERNPLTGDWVDHPTWFEEHGITLAPRLTQFYQGLAAGDDPRDFEYGGKADLLLNSDLSKLGFWDGLSATVHTEYNYGESINGAGGTLVPPNTALIFPGMEDADAFDLSSVYLTQHFSKSVSLLVGKINMMDLAATKPFMGGAGIDSL